MQVSTWLDLLWFIKIDVLEVEFDFDMILPKIDHVGPTK